MNTRPLVSLYIPTYNRRPLLERALNSARAQTFQDIEILVVDDCSADDTAQYLQEVSRVDSRVRFFPKPSNSGACSSRNIAITNARAELVTGLDDDDFLLPDHIEELVKTYSLEEQRSASPIAVFPQMAAELNEKGLYPLSQPFREVKLEHLKVKNFVGNQILTRTRNFIESGLFNEALPAWQDYDLWLRMASSGIRFVKSDKASYIYELESGSGQISRRGHLKLLQAFEIVASNPKLQLTRRERLILKLNYYRYPQSPMPISHLTTFFKQGIFLSPSKTALKKAALRMRSLFLNE